MTPSRSKEKLAEKLTAIKTLAAESEALLREPAPDVEKLLATLQAQSGLQQALMEKLLEAVHPTKKEKDLTDTFQLAVQELLEYFRERTRLAGKVADAAAIQHLREK